MHQERKRDHITPQPLDSPSSWAVLLEAARYVPNSLIISRDDFAEFQDRYALELFAPGRFLEFEPTGRPGDGHLRVRKIRQKDVQQLATDQDILGNLLRLVDILLSLSAVDEARKFCADYKDVIARPHHADLGGGRVILFADLVIDCLSGKRPGWFHRRRLEREFRRGHDTQSDGFIRQNVASGHEMLAHLGAKLDRDARQFAERMLNVVNSQEAGRL